MCAFVHEDIGIPDTSRYCTECGSADLSTPSPSASLSHRLSGFVLYLFAGVAVGLFLVTAILGLVYSIDWSALSGPFLMMVLMLGVLYWATTLLPGPIKKLGKAAGRQVMKSIKKDKHG